MYLFLIAFIETKRCFFFISADGITYTQGIYVVDLKLAFNEGSAAVSWISSILVRFLGFLSLIAPERSLLGIYFDNLVVVSD